MTHPTPTKQTVREIDLKHMNRRGKCLACEKMYRYSIEILEKQNKLLLEMLTMKKLTEPIVFIQQKGLLQEEKHE